MTEYSKPQATHDLDGVVAQALAWRAAGHKVALATVAKTWGSSPRPAGSKLAVNNLTEFVGSVSGGCIEGAVIQEALEVMASGQSRVLEFGVSDETAWEVGLACGGNVQVFVEAVTPEVGRGITRPTLEALLEARRAKQPVVLVTPLDGSPHRLVPVPATGEPAAFAAALADVVQKDQAEVFEGGRLLEPQLAPLRLVIVGAVHVAQPLAEMARLAGFAVTIVDPRRAFATAARFPGQALVVRWPDVAIADLALDARSAVVTLTHDPKLDDPALITALATPAFYVGCLGSKKTHAARRARLAEGGVTAAALDRLRGPVGLPINARTPAEIAVSVLAEVIGALRGAPGLAATMRAGAGAA
ncbi:MAG TPA: XdhC/CoxI family protein [Kofleriaceae bacterium]|nr:XdhC/CoxI family protein [Kofleriaceae bacterium]